MTDTIGLTKDAGWELGVRRTVPLAVPEVWDFLLGEGRPIWLGRTELGTGKGDAYVTDDGVRGEIRGRTDGARVRLTWQPPDRDHASTVQLTVLPAASGTTIAIHHERLTSRAEREERLARRRAVVDRFEAVLLMRS